MAAASPPLSLPNPRANAAAGTASRSRSRRSGVSTPLVRRFSVPPLPWLGWRGTSRLCFHLV
uniref:Uncharacterized protein n=1 Tax=Oryza meridionalis TaxID=40149 RepID=A0A0E0E552_9ORYZ